MSIIMIITIQGLASLEIRTVFDQPELEALGRYATSPPRKLAQKSKIFRGELELELSLSRAPAQRLTAILVPRYLQQIFALNPKDFEENILLIKVFRLSCDIFDCVLQPENSLQVTFTFLTGWTKTMFVFCLKLYFKEGQGMAFLYFTRTGGLSYNIRVEVEDEVRYLSAP